MKRLFKGLYYRKVDDNIILIHESIFEKEIDKNGNEIVTPIHTRQLAANINEISPHIVHECEVNGFYHVETELSSENGSNATQHKECD